MRFVRTPSSTLSIGHPATAYDAARAFRALALSKWATDRAMSLRILRMRPSMAASHRATGKDTDTIDPVSRCPFGERSAN
jgi:hypothetical protein